MRESCKTILQKLYEYERSNTPPMVFSTDGKEIGIERIDLRESIQYLLRHGYIESRNPYLSTYSIMLTEKGEQYVKNGFKAPNSSNAISFSIGTANNSVIGTQEHVSLSIGNSLEDIIGLIEKERSADEKLLKEMVDIIEKASNESTIKKGLLSKFATVLQRNEWITAPIAAFILEKFFLSVPH